MSFWVSGFGLMPFNVYALTTQGLGFLLGGSRLEGFRLEGFKYMFSGIAGK